MRTLLLMLPVLLALGCWSGVGLPAAALPHPSGPDGLPAGVRPVPGDLLTPFRPPPEPWLSGHRGVDLAAEPGSPVLAAAAGVVSFAGPIAGRGVVVVDHGAVRTTYEPVAASVRVGLRVDAGTTLGTVQAGHSGCAPASCLHWGLRRGADYLDPFLLPVASPAAHVRLVGAAEVAATERMSAERALAEAAETLAAAGGRGAGRAGAGGWLAPVAGPITSPFGMRVHPVTGVYKLHDGTDYAAACGTPIRAPLDGVVTEVTRHPAYGWRARMEHGSVEGGRLETSYNHALSYSVRAGDTVSRGQVIGAVGSTGWSTGCHLHLMAWRDGVLVDPAGLG